MKLVNISTVWVVVVVLAVLWASAAPASGAKAPVGKTYFIVSIGVASEQSEAYEIGVGCLTFTRTELCGEEDCGRWWNAEEDGRARRQMAIGFEFNLTDDETGALIDMDGTGRIDARGPKSSIAGVARGVERDTGVKINFSLAGRQTTPANCAQLVADFEANN